MLNTTFRPSAHAAGPAPGRRWTGDEEFVAFLNRLTSSQHTQDVDDANAFLPLNSDNVQTPIISSPSPFPYEFDDSSLPSLKGIKAQILFRKPGAALIALSRPRPTTSTNDDEHESKNAINIDIPLGAIVSSYLPRFYKLISLPSSPLPPHPLHLSSSSRTQEDGREDATATSAVRAVLKSLAVKGTSPKISCIIANLSLAQMIEDVQVLTGETPLPQSPGKDDATVTGNEERLRTRHSFSSDALKAAAWIRDVVEASGGGVDCEVRQFLEGFAPNVICENGGGGNQTIILSAHYDSRGSYGSTRAPGGDDDGSGVVGVLGIARVLGGREGKGVGTHVELVFFAGEEQGLLGSRSYAQSLRLENVNVTLMIQADMLGYHVPGEEMQLGLPDRIATPEVTQLVVKLAEMYSPELSVGFTPACCSDHQSFYQLGFPSTQVFERAGPIADPMYHHSGDVSQRLGYDMVQVRAIGKVQFAALLHMTGIDFDDASEDWE
ncbi:Zn-dependent exopeptidase [Rickenella mellea]|uniref:Peptide hydrolase n=1 Tax=Rickenella mellea TaxID=50990 RepID=A0A4Y7QIR8_9AGAM|nr:Zn-dependent exopeptidase [Rickenella mellea]